MFRPFIQAFICLSAPVLIAQDFTVPLMPEVPVVDGKINSREWAVSAGFEGFQYKGKLERRRVHGFVGATEDSIYVAIRSQLPADGELRLQSEADSLKVVFDDSLEVYISPRPDQPARVDYQFLTNFKGKGGYNVHLLGGAQEEVAWKGNWKQAHGFHGGYWHFECAIPTKSMKLAKGRKTTEGVWGINLTRNWKNPWTWSSTSGGYANSGRRFLFVAEPALTVQHSCAADPFLAPHEHVLYVVNPSKAALYGKASIVLERNRMPTLRVEKALSLKGGASAKVKLLVPENDPTTRYTLKLLVSSRDGKTIYYKRELAYPRGKPYKWIVTKKKKSLPIDFMFAYYPYRNRLRLVADIRGLPEKSKLTALKATVRQKADKKAVKVIDMPVDAFKQGRQEITAELPPLAGEYEIALKGEGEGVPKDERVKSFERRTFPWEGNKMGRSTKVYPPFTPIEVRGNTVRTVLRTHIMNSRGLWDQVSATSAHTSVTKPVLASPMRYMVKARGLRPAGGARRLEFSEAQGHRAVARSKFHVGSLTLEPTCTWDYDGCMRVDLKLTGGKESVEQLRLEIPFRADAATLIHANSDRIRAPIAQRIPAGEGVVWDARKVAVDEHIRNFCPYVYVGTAVRGICWFAENDRDWGRNPETPSIDVVRRGNQVILRVHLINQPTKITEPRTITFGLMAAPAKPRLSPPGKHWWRYRYLRDSYTLLGTDINWLSMGTCGSLKPAGGEMYFWEMISKGNREQLGKEEVEKVVERGRKYFTPYGKNKVDSWERHVRHNLRSRHGKKMVFYYNRASHQASEEFETFKDEWTLTDTRSVGKGRGIGEIKIVPSESYVDCALYWYAKSFKIGNNKGVYWDNWFLAPSFNTEMTEAYAKADGTVVPAAGIWGQRELIKRTFVMLNERGMLPITFPHMTSFNPLPMMSFATVQYDWEWKYSLGDVQDRHTRELILLMSTGDLAGVWPVPLGDHGKLSNDPWTQRTFTAVRLVHELDGYGGFGHGWVPAHASNRKLANHILKLLDDEKLDVFRYWDERPQPVLTDNPDVPTIVYSVPGKETVVAVVSYANKQTDVVLTADLKALGLGENGVVRNVESDQALRLEDAKLKLRLKKHDIIVLRFLPMPPK